MRKKTTATIAIAICGVLCDGGWGQTTTTPPATPPGNLTLTQAVALAIKNHPQVAAARNVALATGQHVVQAKASYYPTIAAEITGAQANDLSRIGAGFLQASSLFNRNGEGFQASQLVTDFGRRSNLVANSRLLAQAADQTTQATTFDVVYGVNRAYFGVLEAKAYVQVAQETVTARQTLTDQVVALANANLKSQVDVEFAQVNLSEAKLMLIRAQDAVKRAFSDLARALGEDNATEYTLEESPAAPAASGFHRSAGERGNTEPSRIARTAPSARGGSAVRRR